MQLPIYEEFRWLISEKNHKEKIRILFVFGTESRKKERRVEIQFIKLKDYKFLSKKIQAKSDLISKMYISSVQLLEFNCFNCSN